MIPKQKRHAALEPFLRQIEQPSAALAAVMPTVCEIEAKLDGWEKNQLARVRDRASCPEDMSGLIAEGVALQAKVLSDMGALQKASQDTDAASSMHQRLGVNATVGLALLEETQRVINLMILGGKLDDAKKMSGFRNKIGQSVTRVKDVIGREAYAAAESRSIELISDPSDSKSATAGPGSETAPSNGSGPAGAPAQATPPAPEPPPIEVEPFDFDEARIDARLASVLAALDAIVDNPDADWAPLAQSVERYQATVTANVQALDATPEEAQREPRCHLVHDTVVGLRLMSGTQERISTIIQDGRIEEAKRLSAFRNRVVQSVARIKDTLAPPAYASAQVHCGITPHSEAAARAEAAGRTEALEALKRQAEAMKAATEAAKGTDGSRSGAKAVRNRVVPLLAVLGASVLLWAVFILPRASNERIPVITMQQLPRSEAILRVTARPPSLYVTIDAGAWDRMTKDERIGLIDQVGARADELGYMGAQLHDPEGLTLGQWFKKRGAKLAANPTPRNRSTR